MKVIVEETCIGCGLCSQTCPEVFEMTDDGALAIVKLDVVPHEVEESCRAAAADCPVEAIKISE